MNLTKLLAGNFSKSILDCYYAAFYFREFMIERYVILKSDISNFLLAYLFNFMGKILRIKSIFEEIDDDIRNQYYADVATQYGRLIDAIFFDFDLSALSQANFTLQSSNPIYRKVELCANGSDCVS